PASACKALARVRNENSPGRAMRIRANFSPQNPVCQRSSTPVRSVNAVAPASVPGRPPKEACSSALRRAPRAYPARRPGLRVELDLILCLPSSRRRFGGQAPQRVLMARAADAVRGDAQQHQQKQHHERWRIGEAEVAHHGGWDRTGLGAAREVDRLEKQGWGEEAM